MMSLQSKKSLRPSFEDDMHDFIDACKVDTSYLVGIQLMGDGALHAYFSPSQTAERYYDIPCVYLQAIESSLGSASEYGHLKAVLQRAKDQYLSYDRQLKAKEITPLSWQPTLP